MIIRSLPENPAVLSAIFCSFYLDMVFYCCYKIFLRIWSRFYSDGNLRYILLSILLLIRGSINQGVIVIPITGKYPLRLF